MPKAKGNSKVKLAAATVAVLAILSVFLFSSGVMSSGTSSRTSSIPWVSVKDEAQPVSNNTSSNGITPISTTTNQPAPKIITGNVRYDLTVNYKDGSHDTFSDTFQLPSLALGSLLNQNKTKEIGTIEVSAYATLNIPQDSGHQISDVVHSESTMNLLVGQTPVSTYNHATTIATQAVGMGWELYHYTINASDIKLASGTYDLNMNSYDRIRLDVDGVTKTMEIKANPSLKVASTGASITPISVVTYTPAVSSTLTNDPVYTNYSCATPTEPNKTCQQLQQYAWFVTIKATGFKANTDLTYKIEDHSYIGFVTGKPLYPASVTVKSDTNGAGQYKQQVAVGLTAPSCVYNQVGGYVTISDGQSTVGPALFQCIYR